AQTAVLTGTGVATPTRTLSVNDVTLQDTVVGNLAPSETMTVTNTGTADVTMSSELIQPQQGSTPLDLVDFQRSFVAPAPGSVLFEGAVLHAGGNCVEPFTMLPRKLGPQTATVTFNSDATNSPLTATLRGTGITGAKTFTVSPNFISFPDTLAGTTSA